MPCSPLVTSEMHGMAPRGVARAFAASKPHFSQKLRSAVGNVYLPVQRVPNKAVQLYEEMENPQMGKAGGVRAQTKEPMVGLHALGYL